MVTVKTVQTPVKILNYFGSKIWHQYVPNVTCFLYNSVGNLADSWEGET